MGLSPKGKERPRLTGKSPASAGPNPIHRAPNHKGCGGRHKSGAAALGARTPQKKKKNAAPRNAQRRREPDARTAGRHMPARTAKLVVVVLQGSSRKEGSNGSRTLHSLRLTSSLPAMAAVGGRRSAWDRTAGFTAASARSLPRATRPAFAHGMGRGGPGHAK